MDKEKKLNQFFATAICGNDILSSVLYVSGFAIFWAGVYAPLVLLAIGGVLFLYKMIYTEVVEALPVNGGAYNGLLNGTSKKIAAVAGSITFLSYVATAVISAKTAIAYVTRVLDAEKLASTLKLEWLKFVPGFETNTKVFILVFTAVLLLIFALLVNNGIKDSARVALTIFLVHILVLVAFLVLSIVFVGQHGFGNFVDNFHKTHGLIMTHRYGIWTMLFFSFAASLLGVSGFESSANFVEEQQKGVFRKTLRNMLIGVTVFNPLIAFAVLSVMPYEMIAYASDFLLADGAQVIGGSVFKAIVVADALFVLAGAVLTSYVGVSGLLSRMAGDRCIPTLLNRQNKHAAHSRIIFLFFVLCVSILYFTNGETQSLGGVYAIAFLSVMSMFAIGNLILKVTRPDLERTYSARWYYVIPAFLATALGIAGQININHDNFNIFLSYFVPVMVIVSVVLYQDVIISALERGTQSVKSVNTWLHKAFDEITKDELVVFVSSVSRLFSILEYVAKNESGRNIVLVHCKPVPGDTRQTTVEDIQTILMHFEKANVHPQFKIRIMTKDKVFGPEVVDEVARELKVNKSKVFIGSVHSHHPFEYSDFEGARIIF
jgi:amino acid transporter